MFARANENENMLRTNRFVRMEKLCVLTSLIFGKLVFLIIYDMLFIKKMKPSLNIRSFLRLKRMYTKFKITILNNARVYLGF